MVRVIKANEKQSKLELNQTIYATYDKLIEKVEDWALTRELNSSDPSKQFIKLQEEVGELAQAHLKGYSDKLRDSIGDIQVVLIIYCLQNNIDYKKTLLDAYNVIENRKGKMINGSFVKDEDLEEH